MHLQNGRTDAESYNICRGRCLHRPATAHLHNRTIWVNCHCRQIYVGERFYPSRRYNAANLGAPMRIRMRRRRVPFRCCILRGRGRTPPLRKINTSSLFTITYPAPPLRYDEIRLPFCKNLQAKIYELCTNRNDPKHSLFILVDKLNPT